MQILLINPSYVEEGRDLYSAHLLGPLFTLQPTKKMTLGLPAALPTLAAMTPAHHKVTIVDEDVEPIDFSANVDLVGITAMTYKATRAYAIAKKFRQRNVPVVMGGVHASMVPDEVAKHVDTVVVGEAEDLWPELLKDFENKKLKPIYQAVEFPDISKSPVPRYDLVKCRSYLYTYLQTTRGCPYNCDFCTVTQMNGRKLRRKTVQQVIEEIDMVVNQRPMRPFRVWDKKVKKIRKFVGAIAFIDDNFAIDREHALKISKAILEYQETNHVLFFWYTQVNFAIGFDQELLDSMEKSGCRHLFIGFENLDLEVLKSMNKEMNDPNKYGAAINNIEKSGMQVVYSTIFDDHASVQSGEQLVKFLEKEKVFHVLLNILTPFPGTALRKRMERDDRILTNEPHKCNIRNVVYRPETMPTVMLEALYMNYCRKLYSFDHVYSRGRELIKTYGDRFIFPYPERIAVFLGTILSALLLIIQRRLSFHQARQLAKNSFSSIVSDGSLLSFEVLLASTDYQEFLDSEMDRMGRSGGGRRAGLATELTQKNLVKIPLTDKVLRSHAEYKSLYISSDQLKKYGIDIPADKTGRPVLILGGTSMSLENRNDFFGHILCSGFEVATIQNPLGSLFDIDIDPVRERVASLTNYLETLRTDKCVSGVDIVAQSYSAFEVVRVLSASSELRAFVKSVVLINPPGFDSKNNSIKHALRFMRHVSSGFTNNLLNMFRHKQESAKMFKAERKDFSRREIKGISFWTIQTFANPTRTLKELKDITGYRIKAPLKKLMEQGVPFYLFLQSEDKLVTVATTIREALEILPEKSIKVVNGGHNDLFFQPWQRDEFCAFLAYVRELNPITGNPKTKGKQLPRIFNDKVA